ncbi:MAG: hypothetical protein AMJ95_09665 [Omnitrophica WOR_2 bacterium SM23_72]|nr:MAG: hypothetical protein AMJ95_09665 [Omnitrophica WOR_2 bacterium SM23_72]
MRKILLAIILAFCCASTLAHAGDTSSLPVSCTIPAIPGVNTPLLEQEQVQLNPEAEELIQQDAQAASVSVSSAQVLVKTYYAR